MYCCVCLDNVCKATRSFSLDNKHRKVVCNKCLAETRSPLVVAGIREGKLSAPEVLRVRVGGGCPPACLSASHATCEVSRRANLLDEFLAVI